MPTPLRTLLIASGLLGLGGQSVAASTAMTVHEAMIRALKSPGVLEERVDSDMQSLWQRNTRSDAPVMMRLKRTKTWKEDKKLCGRVEGEVFQDGVPSLQGRPAVVTMRLVRDLCEDGSTPKSTTLRGGGEGK